MSLDGFRPDYFDSLPLVNLRALAARGVRARWMVPVMPTLTFPNHYTLVTGLYPAHHGIVGNAFTDPTRPPGRQRFTYTDTVAARDSSWWGGEPIWVTARKQGRQVGTFFWPGSEAAIQGTRPTFWKYYVDAFPNPARVDSGLAWLTRSDSLRTSVVLLYFSLVDHEAHNSGPWSAATREAALGADSLVGRLVRGLEAQGLSERVNLVIVSDHGLALTPADQRVLLDDYVSVDSLEIIYLTPFLLVRPRNDAVSASLEALRRVPHLSVFPRDSVPAGWRMPATARITPIVGVMDDGWVLARRPAAGTAARAPQLGAHGYDNALPSMRATFIAAGPSFKPGIIAEPFGNVHLYELLCRILGLAPARNDGSLDSVRGMLR